MLAFRRGMGSADGCVRGISEHGHQPFNRRSQFVFLTMGDSGDSVIRQDYLKKVKTKQRKYFVLHRESCSGPSRLEYYDSKRRFVQKNAAKRTINIKSCFHIEATSDAKNKFTLTLYTRDYPFAIAFETVEERDIWLSLIMELNHSENDYDNVWNVEVKDTDVGKNYAGSYWLCLKNQKISFLCKGTHETKLSIYLAYIRSCGDRDNFFQLEVGRQSPTGEGPIWLQVEDSTVAQNMHSVIVSAMKATDTYRERSGSTIGPSATSRRAPSRHSTIGSHGRVDSFGLSREGKLFDSRSSMIPSRAMEERRVESPRHRLDSASSHSSSHGLSVDDCDRGSSHGSRSITPEPPHHTSTMGSRKRESESRHGGSSSLSSSMSSFGSSVDIGGGAGPYMAMELGKHHSKEAKPTAKEEGYVDMSAGIVPHPLSGFSQDSDFPNRRYTVGERPSVGRLGGGSAGSKVIDQPYVDMTPGTALQASAQLSAAAVPFNVKSRSAPHLPPATTRHQSTPQLSVGYCSGTIPSDREHSPTPSVVSSAGSSLGSARIGHDLHTTIHSVGSQSDVKHPHGGADAHSHASTPPLFALAYDRPRTSSESYHQRPRVSSLDSGNPYRPRSSSYGMAASHKRKSAAAVQRTKPALSSAAASAAATVASYRAVNSAGATSYMEMRGSPMLAPNVGDQSLLRSRSLHGKTQSYDGGCHGYDTEGSLRGRLSAAVDSTPGDYVDLGTARSAAAAAAEKENRGPTMLRERPDLHEPFPELSSGSSSAEDVSTSGFVPALVNEPPRRGSLPLAAAQMQPPTVASPDLPYMEMQPAHLKGLQRAGSGSGFAPHHHSLNTVSEGPTDLPRHSSSASKEADAYMMMTPEVHVRRAPSPVAPINTDLSAPTSMPLPPPLPSKSGPASGSPSLKRQTAPPALPALPAAGPPPLPPLPSLPTSTAQHGRPQTQPSEYMEMAYQGRSSPSETTSAMDSVQAVCGSISSIPSLPSPGSLPPPPPPLPAAASSDSYMAMNFQLPSSAMSTDGSGGSSETTVVEVPDDLFDGRAPLIPCSYIRQTSHDSLGELKPVTCYIQDEDSGDRHVAEVYDNEKDVDESLSSLAPPRSPVLVRSPAPHLGVIQEQVPTPLASPVVSSHSLAGGARKLAALAPQQPSGGGEEGGMSCPRSPTAQEPKELVYASLDLSADPAKPPLPKLPAAAEPAGHSYAKIDFSKTASGDGVGKKE